MSYNFEKYASKANEFVNTVAEDLKMPKEKTGRIIRAVFHALRNRISHEESFQLIAQLPMALKGVYVDGWKFDKGFNRISHVKDFLDEVRQEDGELAGYDFGNDEKAKHAVTAVFKALSYFVSEGEMEDIIATIPKELKVLIKKMAAGSREVF
jgi:uncharacterized protein (DUF2267 family)